MRRFLHQLFVGDAHSGCRSPFSPRSIHPDLCWHSLGRRASLHYATTVVRNR